MVVCAGELACGGLLGDPEILSVRGSWLPAFAFALGSVLHIRACKARAGEVVYRPEWNVVWIRGFPREAPATFPFPCV